MSYHIQSSFAAGELDPALHERTAFDKYQSGLTTLRNAFIGKTGRIISRSGNKLFLAAKSATASAHTFTADAASDYCISGDHGYGTGTLVRLTTTGTLPAGLSLATDYYVHQPHNETSYFKLSTSLANAIAGVVVNITGAGVGTHTVTPVSVGSKKSIIYSPPYTRYIIEWGHRYVRIHDTTAGTNYVAGHDFLEDDLDYLQFVPSGDFLYIFRAGKITKKMKYASSIGYKYSLANLFLTPEEAWRIPPYPLLDSTVAATGTGYNVTYAFSYVVNGEESVAAEVVTDNIPIAAGESNTYVIDTSVAVSAYNGGTSIATEVRAYRRPAAGGGFGYIGSTSVDSGTQMGTFTDFGDDADYSHAPIDFTRDPINRTYLARTGAVYQQRLVMNESPNVDWPTNSEEILRCSRTGFQNNFTRDFPLAADSSMTFKCGTSDSAKILRLVDSTGLLAFTTVGIYQSDGALSPDNLAMAQKGNWVIDEKVPPLKVPGGLLFVDSSTNTIRSLIFSNEAGGYPGEELSIFSNHLFMNKKVKSWAFQEGDTPLIWVVMDDGSLNVLTYQREHQMQAWSHHDSDGGLFESVTVLKDLTNKSVVYFVVNRDGTRLIEYSTPRFVADLKLFVGVDSAVTYNSQPGAGTATITVTANTPGVWDGPLTLTSDIAAFANTTDNGAAGTTFRFFDSEGSAVDLVVTTYTSTTVVVVEPSALFPEDEGVGAEIYKTYSVLTGLSHLEGKEVSIFVDGYVEASPNNDVENYESYVVTGGQVTLSDSRRGAFVHVGLPFTADIETLDIDTVEQKPTLLESRIVHSVYLKVYNTRGLYVGSKLLPDESVQNMRDPEERTEDIDLGNVGNAAQAPATKRHSITIPNDWNSNGRICIRQVDPLPFEILSIIPDLSVVI